jgi:HlyD family secretion protein
MRSIVKYSVYLMFALVAVSCGKNKHTDVKPVLNDITETVFASGSLDAKDRYNLTAQSEGYISEINIEEGDSVQLNQVFAVISNVSNDANSVAARAQLEIAQYNLSQNAPAIKDATASLEFAESKLAQDEKQLNRYKELYKQNSVSALDLENAQLTYQNSAANVKSLKEKLNLLKQQAKQAEITQRAQSEINSTNASYNQLKALSNGKVVKRIKQRGDYVRKGDVIATIANEQTVIARLNVDENSISKVKIGQVVKIRLNVTKDKVSDATITEIYPMFDEASQSFICEARFIVPSEFDIIGTQLEANIVIGEKKNVLLIPRSYLSFTNTVQVKGEEETRAIEVGIKSTEWVEVLSGITAEDVLTPLKK